MQGIRPLFTKIRKRCGIQLGTSTESDEECVYLYVMENNGNLFSLEGKVALVTGAAYGIGMAMAEALARAGARIAFNCRKQEHMDAALAA